MAFIGENIKTSIKKNTKDNIKKNDKKFRKKCTLKRIVAIMLIISLLPFGEFGNIYLSAAAEEMNNQIEENNGENNQNNESVVSDNVEEQEEIYEDLEINDGYTLSENKVVNNLTIKSGTLNLNGYKMVVLEECKISGGKLWFNGGTLEVGANFTATNRSIVVMENANDYLKIDGNILLSNSADNDNKYTNGVIEVKGDVRFSLGGNFRASSYHKIICTGYTKQEIFVSESNTVNILELNNYSNEGVNFQNYFTINELIDNGCKYTYGGIEGNHGFSLEEDMVIEDSVYLTDGRIELNGHMLVIKGDLVQAAGVIDVQGGSLIIEGDYRQQTISNTGTYEAGNALLVMTNPSDVVNVHGGFYCDTKVDTRGYLSDGQMIIGGDFEVIGSKKGSGFIPEGNHKVVLNGTEKQVIKIKSDDWNYSYIQNIEIMNSSEEGIETDGYISIYGNVSDKDRKLHGDVTAYSGTVFTDGYFDGNLKINSEYKLTEELTVNGNLYLNAKITIYGKLHVNGSVNTTSTYDRLYMKKGVLIVEKDMTVNGNYSIVMSNAEDYIIVFGNTNFESSYMSYFEQGCFEIKGNFISHYTIYAKNDFRFLFSGDKEQVIDIIEKSELGTVEITNTSTEGVVSERIFNKYLLITNESVFSYRNISGEVGRTLYEDEVVDGDLYLIDGVLDLNGHTLIINGDLIQSCGTIKVNGGKLIVNKSYRIQTRTGIEGDYQYSNSHGNLEMKNPEDYVFVNDDFIVQRYRTEEQYITEGIIELKGNFNVIQKSYYFDFSTYNNNLIILSGDKEQNVDIPDSDYASINIQNMEFRNTSEEGINFKKAIYVPGHIKDNGCNVKGVIDICASTTFENNRYTGSVYIVQDMTIKNDLYIGGNLYCNRNLKIQANLTVAGTLTHNGYQTSIYTNNGSLTVYGDFKMPSGYGVTMKNSNDYILVYGNVESKTTYGQSFSCGVFEIKGNLYYANYLHAYGTNRFVFSGDKKQTIDIPTTSTFATIEISNTSNEGVVSKYLFTKDELITNGCNFRYEGIEGEIGYNLDTDEIYDGDFVLIDGKLDLNGHTLTVYGDFILAGGKLNINNGKLIVEGNFIQRSRYETEGTYTYGKSLGTIIMQNENDYLLVKGSFISATSIDHTGYLTNGIIEIKKDFTVYTTYSSNGFVSTDNHKVIFSGSERQTIYFEKTHYTNSRIANIELSEGTNINFSNYVYISKSVTDNADNIDGYLWAGSNTVFVNGRYSGNIYNEAGITFSQDVTIEGDFKGTSVVNVKANVVIKGDVFITSRYNLNIYNSLHIEGDLTFKGVLLNMSKGELVIEGNLSVLPYYLSEGISMSNEEDYIHVYGDVIYNTNYPRYYLSNGTFEIEGNLTADRYIKATEKHRFVFSGNKAQEISTLEGDSFAILEINNTSEEGVYSKNYIATNETIINEGNWVYGNRQGKLGFTLSENMEYDGEFILVGEELNLNGHTLTVKGDFVLAGGTLNINGGTLNIEGDLRLQNKKDDNGTYKYTATDGVLAMTNEADSITILGDFILQMNYEMEQIHCGTINLAGDLMQIGQNGYKGCENNKIIFNGKNKQTVSSNTNITIGKLENSNSSELRIDGNITVLGETKDSSKNISGTGNILVSDISQIYENEISGRLVINGECAFEDSLYVDGTLTISGEVHLGDNTVTAKNIVVNAMLYIEKGTILCESDFSISKTGAVIMNDSEGNITIGGNFVSSSTKYTSGMMTDGTIEVKGDFTVDGTYGYIAEGNHKTVFSNKRTMSGRLYIQAVKITNTLNNRINILVLGKTEDKYQSNVSLNSVVNQLIIDEQDIIPPSPVEEIVTEKISVNSVTIRYYGAEDDTYVAGYEIYRNGIKYAITSMNTFKDTGLTPNTIYIYQVYPFDENRNICEESIELRVVTEVDNELPEAPSNLQVVNRNGNSVTLRANESYDNAGIAFYSVYRDGEIIATNLNKPEYKDESLSDTKAYMYCMTATDIAGNESEKSAVVDAAVSMPCITNISPTDYSNISGKKVKLKVIFKNECNSVNNTVKIEYLDKENNWHLITEEPLTQNRYDNTSLYVEYTWDIASKSISGENTVRYTLCDEAGYKDIEYCTYFVDKEPPVVAENIRAISDNGVVKIYFDPSTSSDCAGYKIYRKNASEENYAYLSDITGAYSIGFEDKSVEFGKTYDYVITSYDFTGNESNYSESVSIVVDEDKCIPYIEKISPQTDRINKSINIEIEAKDNKEVSKAALFYKSVDDTEWIYIGDATYKSGKYNVIWDTTMVNDGDYLVSAIATDTNGNTSDGTYTRRYTVDNTGTEKLSITKCTATSTTASVSWSDTSETDFLYFQLEMLENGQYVTVGTERNVLGYNVTNLMPQTTYTFRVVGYDNLGNRGIESDEVSITTGADNVNPVITKIDPAPSSYRNTINLSLLAKDNACINYAEFSYSYDKVNFTEIGKVYCDPNVKETTFAQKFDISSLPEGKVYVRFRAYDASGNQNALLEDGEDVIAEYVIDRTAPAKIENLVVTGNEGYVGLTFDSLSEEDVKCYRIYRADADTGVYRIINANCTTKNYYDTGIEYGQTYSYKVTAVDNAGNEGQYSNEVYISVANDSINPKIEGVSVNSGDILGKNPTIKVLATDNALVDKVVLEYRKTDDSDAIWTEIKSEISNNNIHYMAAKWVTDEIEDGEYTLRAYAIDKFENTSTYFEVNCFLKQNGIVAPSVEALTSDNKIILNITSDESEDFSYYIIYRKLAGQSEYCKIAVIDEDTYIDTRVELNKVYCYKVGIVDKYGNENISEMSYAYANDIDVTAPIAVLPDNYIGMTGMEMAFDGMASTDNKRIVEYQWNMGNGDVIYGAKPIYTYDRAGVYTVSLLVKDEAGNEDITYTTVQILEKTGRGRTKVKIVDDEGRPVPYALVYLQLSEGDNLSLKADNEGYVTVVTNIGSYQIAAYKEGYLPNDMWISVNQYMDNEYTLSITEDELIVGKLTVQRMDLVQMIEAGVDFSNPDNYNVYTFSVNLAFMEMPIPTVYEFDFTGGGSGQQVVLNKIHSEDEPNKSEKRKRQTVVQKIDFPPNGPYEAIDEDNFPMLAFLSTGGSIAWLKEMYNVELDILNAADSKYCITGSTATLGLPESGMSLAATRDKQELVKEMGDIYGQQTASTSWIVRGDKPGLYDILADFKGILQPFDVEVSASFKTENPVDVSAGTGVCIDVYVENAAYINEAYYIRFKIRNLSGRTLYNFIPKLIGQKTINEEDFELRNITVNNSQLSSQAIVLDDGSQINIPVFAPGDELSLLEILGVAGSGNPDEVYYKLVGYGTKVVKGEDLGVSLNVHVMAAHISKVNVKKMEFFLGYADPVDIGSGAFTDEYNVMTVNGASELSVNLTYDSRIVDSAGDFGYGWNDDYSMHLEEKNGIISYYPMNSESSLTFIKEEFLEKLEGMITEDGIIVDDLVDYSYGEYICLNEGREDERIVKNEDGTYTYRVNNRGEYLFDSNGRIILLKDDAGLEVSVAYNNNEKIITDMVSGKYIKLHTNDDGLVTYVVDNSGRNSKLSYEDGKLVAITNPMNETIHYKYDDERRIIEEWINDYDVSLRNEYDAKGRVTKQTNALSDDVLFEYIDNPLPQSVLDDYEENMECTYEEYVEEMSKYVNTGMTVVITDELGNRKSAVVDGNERIVEVTNENGSKTYYAYDGNGNNVHEKDCYGNVILREYDAKGNLIRLTDTGNCVTETEYDDDGNPVVIKAEDGRYAYYTYNSKNQLVSYTDFNGLTTTYEYNQYGKLISEGTSSSNRIKYTYVDGELRETTDLNGNVTKYRYDGAGNLISTTDALGNTSYTEYDLLGRVVKETDVLGNTTSYTYDALGNRTSVTDMFGTTYYEYDAQCNNTGITNPDGSKQTIIYDKLRRPVKQIYADGTYNEFVYDESGNLIKEIMPDGTYVTYTYDLLCQMISETDSLSNTINYEYYPNGKLYKEIYPDGTYNLYTYNKSWNLVSTTDRMGSTSTYIYDSMGNVKSAVDAMGNVTYYTYDGLGRVVKVTDPNGNETTYEYDNNSNCTSVTTPDGLTTHYEYDALNRNTRIYKETSQGQLYEVSYEYDALGRVVRQTDEEGYTNTIEYLGSTTDILRVTDANGNVSVGNIYDEYGRNTGSRNAVGYGTSYQYNNVGELIKIVQTYNDTYVSETTYEYDSIGRVISVTDPLDGNTSRTFDAAGNVTGITDANGGTTSYTYDSLGRLITEQNAIGCLTSYTYDAKGLLKEITDAKNQKTTYTYDALGRVTSLTDDLSTISYTYDSNGNVIKVSDENGSIERKYDCMNRVTEVTDYKGNVVKYGYDEIGNLISITYPGGEKVRYTYYRNGRLKKVIDTEGFVTSYEYDGNGNLITTIRPDGTKESCLYNEAGSITALVDLKGEEVINAYKFEYDERGNIVTISGTRTTETNEGIDRLSSSEMTYDADNRMITYNGEDVLYDANGNMIYGPLNGEMTEFAYDCRNRLVGAGSLTYEYDCENTRIATVDGDTRYEYVIDKVSSSLSNLIEEKIYRRSNTETSGEISGGNETSNGVYSLSETKVYNYGNGLINEYVYNEAVINPNVRSYDDGVSGREYEVMYYHYNNLGSTTALTDADGNITARYTYGPYGELLSGDNTLTRFLYNGRAGVSTDDNSLYYMRSRYYNPEIKRFINRDVVNGSLDNSQSLNKFCYVQGNPISQTDPFGLSPLNGLFTGGLGNGGFLSTVGHALLDFAGSGCGFLSAGANALNAVWYAAEGDYAMAAVCGVSAVTMGFGKLAKLGGASGASNLINSFGKYISNGANFAIGMKGATDTFGDVIERCVGNGEEFTFMDAVEIVVGIACLKGAYNSGKQLASQTASGINSLRRATQEKSAKLAEKVKSGSTKIAQGAEQYASKSGNGVGESGNNTKLNYVTSNGLVLETTPNKTTTVLGTYKSDTGSILDELGNVKSLDFGPRDGGFNLLNTPDELYVSPNQFWNEYNKPWLDNAIARDDIFKIATEPTWDNLTRINMFTGKTELTGFGREYTYLKKHGYSFDAVTKTMFK